MGMIAAKRKIWEDICSDPKYSDRMEKCRSFNDVSKLMDEYCKDKGLKIAVVKPSALKEG